MSRILFLSQLLPYPLDAGPKTRAYYVLRYLSQQHEVTLVCFLRSTDSEEAIKHVRQICQKLVTVPMTRTRLLDGLALARSLISRRSWIITRDDKISMRNTLYALVQSRTFDFIHSDQLWMAQYALLSKQLVRKRYSTQLVLDQHNAVFMIPQRMADSTRNPLFRAFMRLEAQRLAYFEVQACQQFEHVIWVTQEDFQAVNRQAGKSNLMDFRPLRQPPTVIPICVDPTEASSRNAPPSGQQVLFVGGFHWPPNVQGVRWFIQEIWPRVREKIPTARFVAVGKLPPKDFLTAEGVNTPGYVDNLAPYYAQSRVFVVPLLAGGGMRVKILDAWNHSLPVISTHIGAEGIGYEHGKDIVIADHPEEFANHLIKLLSCDETNRRLGDGGRQTVEEQYDWKKKYSNWDKLYMSNKMDS